MADNQGPWNKPAPSSDRPSGRRVGLWILLMILLGLGVWKLAEYFPGQLSSDGSRANAIWLLALLALLSSGIVFARINYRETLRNIAIWTVIALALAVGFAYQSELQEVASRLRSELIPGYVVTTGAKEMQVTASANGHFYVVSEANGTPVTFMIDTGASDIVLSPSDARRLGIDVDRLDFSRQYQTANGVGFGASFVLNSLTIGEMALSDVPVSINKADMGESLLGMSLLGEIASLEIRDRRLFIRWRE